MDVNKYNLIITTSRRHFGVSLYWNVFVKPVDGAIPFIYKQPSIFRFVVMHQKTHSHTIDSHRDMLSSVNHTKQIHQYYAVGLYLQKNQ